MNYNLVISPEVSRSIDEIHHYISHILMSPQGANNTVSAIFESIKQLSIMPESGINIDKKLGVQLVSGERTYGAITKGGRYILFYQLYPLAPETTDIYISHLIPAKTDWMNYLTKP